MSSPTIMDELRHYQYILATAGSYERGYYQWIVGRDKKITPMTLMLAELPERRAWERCEREEAAKVAAGGRSICPKCGKRAAVEGITEAHRDPTVYHRCENCGHVEM